MVKALPIVWRHQSKPVRDYLVYRSVAIISEEIVKAGKGVTGSACGQMRANTQYETAIAGVDVGLIGKNDET
jgi:hypothetical protein